MLIAMRTLLQRNQRRWLLLAVIATLVLIFVGFWFFSHPNETVFTPIDFLWDLHAIFVAPFDPDTVFVATHVGLVRGRNDRYWELIGTDQSDFMGFSLHPTQQQVMYSSGHPRVGQPPRNGLLGLRRSIDGGQTWQPIEFFGEKDLHSIAVSPVDPYRIYVWDGEALLRSDDAGASWTIPKMTNLGFSTNSFENGVNALQPDLEQRNTLLAATNKGLYVSHDAGESWAVVPPFTEQHISAIGSNTTTILAFSSDGQLFIKDSAGIDWLAIEHDLPEIIIDITASSLPNVWYAVSSKAIYKSQNGGINWTLIRTVGEPD